MLKSFLNHLALERRLSPHTLKAYEQDLGQLQHHLLELGIELAIEDAATHHLRSWVVTMMEAGLDPRSMNRKITCLRTFYRFCVERDHREDNPALKVRSLKVSKKLPVYAQREDIMRLLSFLPVDSSFAALRDKMMLVTLYNTGIRQAELIGLKDSDIDLKRREIRVFGKRSKERLVPINKDLAEEIALYLEERKKAFPQNVSASFIVNNSGEACRPEFVYRTVKKLLMLIINLEKRSPHILRHSFATHLLDHQADLLAVKEILGHESLAATQVYTHNSLEKLKKVFQEAHPKA